MLGCCGAVFSRPPGLGVGFQAGWRALPLSPGALPGGQSSSGPSGPVAVAGTGHIWQGRCGAAQRGHQLCVYISLSLARLQVTPRGHTGVLPCPAGGLGKPPGRWDLARHGELCLGWRCRAAGMEGPYGPLCAGLINPECRSGAANPAGHSGSRAAEQSQQAGLNPSVPPEPDVGPHPLLG